MGIFDLFKKKDEERVSPPTNTVEASQSSARSAAVATKEEKTKYPITFKIGVVPRQIYSLGKDGGFVAERWYRAWRMIFENSAEFCPEAMPAKGGDYPWLREPVKFRCSGGIVVLGMDPFDAADCWSHSEADEEEWTFLMLGKSKNYDELFACITRAVAETLKIKISWHRTVDSCSQEIEFIPEV